jgi:hypothetical protein
MATTIRHGGYNIPVNSDSEMIQQVNPKWSKTNRRVVMLKEATNSFDNLNISSRQLYV